MIVVLNIRDKIYIINGRNDTSKSNSNNNNSNTKKDNTSNNSLHEGVLGRAALAERPAEEPHRALRC